jgi:hypothetical protein
MIDAVLTVREIIDGMVREAAERIAALGPRTPGVRTDA